MTAPPVDDKGESSNKTAPADGSIGEQGHEKNGAANGANGTDKLGVWNSVSRWLPPRDGDSDYWWNLTGPHLATLLASADYSVANQFEILLLYWRRVTPILGPAPTAPAQGVSPTTEDGTRIEFSWRWSEDNKPPEIRTAFDPFNPTARTLKNPLGLQSAVDLFHELAPHNDHVDLEALYELIGCMFESPHQMYLQPGSLVFGNHTGVGLEFGQKAVLPKAYLRPRKSFQENKTGWMSLDDWDRVITSAFGQKPIVKSVFDFIRSTQSKPEFSLQPMYIGADVIPSANRRLKLYCSEKTTSFNSLCFILTMGGTKDVPQNALDSIWELLRGMCGLPDDFSKDEELPGFSSTAEQNHNYDRARFWKYFGYYFEMGAQKEVPDIKVYIPTTHYGVNDQVVAETTTRWMEQNGRGKYVPAFWQALHTISSHRRLDEDRGVMLWLSLMIKKGSLQVTTYFSPEAYHPKRFGKGVTPASDPPHDANMPRFMH